MPKLLVACEGCGKELERWPSEIREHVYCSQACRTIRRKRTCAAEGCDVEFVPRNWDIEHRAALYCSRRCAARTIQPLRNNGTNIICPVCGSSRYFAAARLANGRKYCSAECYHIASRKGPDPEPRHCLGCSKVFTPRFPAFDDAQFCSLSCWGKYRRDERPETLVPLFRTFDPQLRQKAIGRLIGRKAGRKGGRRREYDNDQVQRVLELRAKGLTLRSTGRVVGLTKDQVSRIEKLSRNPF
jgi:hypothetical protein